MSPGPGVLSGLPAPAVAPVDSPFAPPGAASPLAPSADTAVAPSALTVPPDPAAVVPAAEPAAPVWSAPPASPAAAVSAADPAPSWTAAWPTDDAGAVADTTPPTSETVPMWSPAEGTAESATSTWWSEPVERTDGAIDTAIDTAIVTPWSDDASTWTPQPSDPWAESGPAPVPTPSVDPDPWAVDETPTPEVWDGPSDDPDAARMEIEALIARAEAEAAAAGPTAPLTFSPPEGVDLRAIVAAEPQEPPRPVLDAAGVHAGADSPEWLTDLVGSISEGADETTSSAVDAPGGKDAAFVHADSRIRGAKERMNGFALMSLVASLLWVCGLGSVVGVVFGVVALVQISSFHQRGRVIALVGLSLGVVGAAAAATLFVFDDGGPAETILEDEPDFGEVIVTSCVLDPNGQGVAVVRLVNTRAQPIRYEVTVAFSAEGTRLVNTGTTAVLEPKATEMVTIVSEGALTAAPVCILQDTVLYVEGG